MDWTLDRFRPISLQLVEKFCVAVNTGEYRPGERLPSVREVAVIAGVNPNTVQKTFEELERRQVVYSIPSRGWYVTDRAVEASSHEVEALRRIKTEEYLVSMAQLGCDAAAALEYLKNQTEGR